MRCSRWHLPRHREKVTRNHDDDSDHLLFCESIIVEYESWHHYWFRKRKQKKKTNKLRLDSNPHHKSWEFMVYICVQQSNWYLIPVSSVGRARDSGLWVQAPRRTNIFSIFFLIGLVLYVRLKDKHIKLWNCVLYFHLLCLCFSLFVGL